LQTWLKGFGHYRTDWFSICCVVSNAHAAGRSVTSLLDRCLAVPYCDEKQAARCRFERRDDLRTGAWFDKWPPMSEYRRPLPQPDRETSFYWDAARRHELCILQCSGCGRYVHYPRPDCPSCQGNELRPRKVSGRGTIHSFTITHYVSAPGFEDAVPFVVALVELDEQRGLRLVANIRSCAPTKVRIGMSVEVVFEDATPTVTLPQFRPRC
jgi:uncharacterized OB-fold protein